MRVNFTGDENSLIVKFSFHVTPCLNRRSTFEVNCSFRDGAVFVMKKSSRIFRLLKNLEAAESTFHSNLWVGLVSRCFAGSDFSDFCVDIGVCSCQRLYAFFPVCPTYVAPHEHTPLYMTHAGCRILSFRGNKVRIFRVFQTILNKNLFLVKMVSLSTNVLLCFSFVSQ